MTYIVLLLVSETFKIIYIYKIHMFIYICISKNNRQFLSIKYNTSGFVTFNDFTPSHSPFCRTWAPDPKRTTRNAGNDYQIPIRRILSIPDAFFYIGVPRIYYAIWIKSHSQNLANELWNITWRSVNGRVVVNNKL